MTNKYVLLRKNTFLNVSVKPGKMGECLNKMELLKSMKRGIKIRKKSDLGHSKIPRWIYWTPRIASILFLLFLAMFSLDVFDTNFDFWSVTIGLIMHNIPVFILTIFLIISWKHELVGAITFLLAGSLYITQLIINSLTNIFEWYYLSWGLTIAGPAIFIGILFLINWKIKRKLKKKNSKKSKRK